jgi:predicted dehydrogenase
LNSIGIFKGSPTGFLCILVDVLNSINVKDELRFAIVGTGSIAGHFIKSIKEIDGCTVSALCSSSESRAKEAFERFQIKTYSNLTSLLEEEDVDIVCICTASGFHLDPALQAARAGKHILCEKPLEINVQRVDQMIAVCEENSVKLGCIFQNRFSEDFIRTHDAVKSGILGKLVAINAAVPWYRDHDYYGKSAWRGTLLGDGGGALINQGIHTVDLFQFVGGNITEVQGLVRTMAHDIEGEDLAQAMVVFENGALGQIQASTAMWPGYPERLEIYGEKGSIILEAGTISQWNIIGIPPYEKPENNAKASGSSDPMAISHQLHRQQISDFAEAVRKDTSPKVDGQEGRKSVALIEAIYQSSKSGEKISLLL